MVMAMALVAGMLSGCASIVSKSNWPVTVQSSPSGAKCIISKGEGVDVHSGETPMTVTLKASDGFFSSAKYIVNCIKEGHQKSTSELSAHLNGWYAGNIVFGGLIGLLIVDPGTGAMWRLDETHTVTLTHDASPAAAVPMPVPAKAEEKSS